MSRFCILIIIRIIILFTRSHSATFSIDANRTGPGELDGGPGVRPSSSGCARRSNRSTATATFCGLPRTSIRPDGPYRPFSTARRWIGSDVGGTVQCRATAKSITEPPVNDHVPMHRQTVRATGDTFSAIQAPDVDTVWDPRADAPSSDAHAADDQGPGSPLGPRSRPPPPPGVEGCAAGTTPPGQRRVLRHDPSPTRLARTDWSGGNA